jgi:SMC interacting uncharacterized protein involved in chromosome segregation
VGEIVAENDGETLRKHVADLESENSKLKATIVESPEEYDVLQLGNTSLLAECTNFRYRCEDLGAELAKAHSNSAVSIASIEANVKSAEAHAMDIAAASEKHLSELLSELVRAMGVVHSQH